MCKDEKLMRMLEMYKEQYEVEMLDEYYYYEDDYKDMLTNLVYGVKLG